jgi:hypothetical protein
MKQLIQTPGRARGRGCHVRDCSLLRRAGSQTQRESRRGGTDRAAWRTPCAWNKAISADLEQQVVYQRAFEAVIWSQPAIGVYGIRRGMFALGIKDNEVMAMSRPARTRHELLTANNTTPCIEKEKPGFSRSFLRSAKILLQNDAILCNAARMLNRRIRSVGNAVQSSEMMRNSLGLNYESPALTAELQARMLNYE